MTFPYYFMKNNDIITFTPMLQRLLFIKMKNKIKQRRLIFALPYYISFCFTTFSLRISNNLISQATLYYPINLNFGLFAVILDYMLLQLNVNNK
jgi:hypothetical protein